MKKMFRICIFLAIIFLVAYGVYMLITKDFSFEEFIIGIWNEHVEKWGYVILFFWSILEGELGLIFAGFAAHDGKLNLALTIFVAGIGGFVGDQIYFYIGRYNKKLNK